MCLVSSLPMTDWFERVPKVEIHLHLEGAIPHDALWELIRKYGCDPQVPNLEALRDRFEYLDFQRFIEIWNWKNGFLREYEDFTYIAEAVARDLARQNLRYVEAFFSPTDFTHYGLKTQRLAEAIRTGLSRVADLSVSLVADLVRDSGAERAAVTLSEVNEARKEGIIGIGIGGSEEKYPPTLFGAVFERARQLNFRTSAHAGEVAGAESVRDAVRILKVDRIGHGTRAEEDDSLVLLLADRRIPLEMCPLSNLRTGVIRSLETHPIRRYFDRGLLVTVNTDDPKMFGNSLAQEYRCLERQLDFSRDEIRSLILQGIEASWLPEEGKKQLSESFRHDPAWLE